MRTTDINKINAIKNSVLDLSQSVGLSNMTTAKISKQAGVSPATIYLHYRDKTDLLSRIYEEVKIQLHEGLDQAIDQKEDLDVQIKQMIGYSVAQYRKYPKQAHFMATLWSNQEMLDQKAIAFGNMMEGALADLIQRIQESEDYQNTSREVLEVFMTVPTLLLERMPDLSEKQLAQISEMVVKAIKK